MEQKTIYSPRMTDEQKALMMERYADTRTEVLAQQLGVNYRTVCRYAVALGLTKSENFKKMVSKTAGKKGVKKYGVAPRNYKTIFDEEKKSYLQQHFATTPTTVLAAKLGVNDRTVRRWAQSLGLTKNHEAVEEYRIRSYMTNRSQARGQTPGRRA